MEKLHFITKEGIAGLTVEWAYKEAEYDCAGWLEKFGPRIGSGTAPLPDRNGWVDLSQFATVVTGNDNG